MAAAIANSNGTRVLLSATYYHGCHYHHQQHNISQLFTRPMTALFFAHTATTTTTTQYQGDSSSLSTNKQKQNKNKKKMKIIGSSGGGGNHYCCISSHVISKRFLTTQNRSYPVKRPSFPASYQPYIRDLQANKLGISHDEQELLRSSGRVVWGAVIINAANFIAKTIAWMYTGSHSMFAESVHSLADTANQLILAVGIRKSLQSPTADHPYGYHPMRYIAPLISGVGIFCVGCGLSIYHGFEALMASKPELFISPIWAYGILTFSLLTESTTLLIAISALRSGARRSNLSIREYIGRNSDPGVIVVLLEDLAAVMGIGIAASSMALTSYYQTHVFDACGSLVIGTLLGGVATFIIKKNTVALVGKSIPRDTLNNINRIIEKDVLIRAIHDVKATDLGNGVFRYKAEVDVDGRELSKKYLKKIDLKELLEDIREIKSEKDAETFILAHGEGVVDLLGAEVDRIEKELRRNHPKVKHVDLEVL